MPTTVGIIMGLYVTYSSDAQVSGGAAHAARALASKVCRKSSAYAVSSTLDTVNVGRGGVGS